jgi:anti-anti-sigma factor
MNVEIKSVSNVTVASLDGELDGNTAPDAQQQILAAVKPGESMVLDLAKVPYTSSAGLRMLLATYRHVTGGGGKVILVGVEPQIKDVMSVTGFLKYFTLQDTVDGAVAEVS